MSQPDSPRLADRLVRHWSRLDPSRVAYATEHEALTYAELESLVRQATQLLSAAGARRGDRVLLLLPPSAEYVVSFLATSELGAVAVPLPASTSADRLAYVTDVTTPRVCVHREDVEVPPGVARLHVTVDFPTARIRSRDAEPDASTPPGITADDDAIILFSSGSTGRPKGVVLKHRHLLAIAENLSTVFRLDREHRELILAPMAHSDGLQRVLSTLFAGGSVVAPTRQLATNAILEFLPAHGITGFFMPPPLLRLIARSTPAAFREGTRTLRSIEFGSAPITVNELQDLSEKIPDARIYLHYGLTECSRAVILDVGAHPDKLGTVGRAAPGVTIRICDADGEMLPAGEEGQIWLRGRQLTDGYWKLDELNREKFSDGWLKTGDFGYLDAEGFLKLQGRRDDMITSAGFHFFPAEVEMELGVVPGAVDYLVAGVPDPRGILEQVPWAFVVPAEPDTWAPHTFLAFARNKVPSHMVPRAAIAVPAIPLAASGKPDRKKAVELYAKKPK